MRATKWFTVAALLAASLSALGSNPPPVNIPDWVSQAAAQPKGSYADDTNAVVLLDETSLKILSSDQYIEHRRRVVRILRPEGRDEAYYGVLFQSQEKVNDVHAWSIDAAGHKFEVKPKEFLTRGMFEEELYNDYKINQTRVPGADVGSIVAFESDVLHRSYDAEFDWFPQENIPTKNAVLSIELPATWEYSAAWANSEEIKPQSIGPNSWKWSLTDLAGIENEPLRPHHLALSKHLGLAFFGGSSRPLSGSWGAIGTWYKNLADPRRAPSPELTEAAHRLANGRVGFDAQVRAVAAFAQRDIRYVDIEIGIGGHQPHFASEVLRHKYGDCKDKAALMATMLSELGYHSEMVLVHTEHGIVKPSVPSDYFNHAVIAVELPSTVPSDAYASAVTTKSGKRYVIFDPTNEYTPFGLVPYYLQNSYALIATSPGELVQLPLLQPDSSINEGFGKFTLGIDGVLSGEIVQHFRGESASRMRNRLISYDGKDRSKFLELIASASLKQASIEAPQFENLKDIDKELVVKYLVKMNGYSQTAGGLLLVRPRVMGDKTLSLPKKVRKYAVELSASKHDRDVFEITLPAGYVVDELPDNTHIDVGFASYDAKIENISGTVLRYTRDYIVKDPHIELSKLRDLDRLENAIAIDQSATAVLKKAP